MKRVFIVHRWEGSPKEGMIAWLKQELEKKGFEANALEMPNTDEPTIEEWVGHLTSSVDNPDEDTYFIGHSIGCQTIMRYLERLPENVKVGGAVFIAGWFNLKDVEPEALPIAKPWLETPIDTEKVKSHTENFVAIFSNNDPYVPLEDKEIFVEKLHAKIIIEADKGHYIAEDKISEVPIALESIISMSEQ